MIRETQSSTRIALGQAIEPAEKTAPPLGGLVVSQLGTAVVDVGPLGQADDVLRRAGRDLVGLVARRAAGTAHVQARLAEEVAVLEARPLEGPVVGIQHAIRRAGHDPGLGEHDAQQVGLRLDSHVEPALVAASLQSAGVAVAVDHGGRSTSSTSQFSPLPPRYMSRPPRS